MSRRDDREAGRTPADQNAYTTEDAFAPGGEPRTDGGADAGDQPSPAGRADSGEDSNAGAADGAARGDGEAATDADTAGGAGDPLQRELEEQRDRYLRLAAEYDNFRRRTQRERQEAGARAQADLVKQLLETLDDLDRFAQVDAGTATATSVVEAVGMVHRKLAKTLVAAGLEIVNPVDQHFDPAFHEALTTAPASSPEEDDTVAQVFQPGYVFGGQLLRPARVVVRQWNG